MYDVKRATRRVLEVDAHIWKALPMLLDATVATLFLTLFKSLAVSADA